MGNAIAGCWAIFQYYMRVKFVSYGLDGKQTAAIRRIALLSPGGAAAVHQTRRFFYRTKTSMPLKLIGNTTEIRRAGVLFHATAGWGSCSFVPAGVRAMMPTARRGCTGI